MSVICRQSTARTVMIGPVLDADGVAVTNGVVGDFKISKLGAAPAALNGSATLTHRHTGHYSLALTASDLDTVGQAEVVIDDTTNACPMKVLTVIEEAVYDALYAASAPGKLEYVDNFIYIDTISGVAGTTVGINGTFEIPSGNLSDAKTLAVARNVTTLRMKEMGQYLQLLTPGTHNLSLYTVDLHGGILYITNAVVQNCIFLSTIPTMYLGGNYRAAVLPAGVYGQTRIDVLPNEFVGLTIGNIGISTYATFKDCYFISDVTSLGVSGTNPIALTHCWNGRTDGADVILDAAGGAPFILDECWGNYTVKNLGAGKRFIYRGWGKLTVHATCSATSIIEHTSHVEVTNTAGAILDLVSDSSATDAIATEVAKIPRRGTINKWTNQDTLAEATVEITAP